ncbi:serine hydrolase domain-containing protein [Actinoplanes couchii]|uniref:Serine hydrolase n=1 Tax=Actinoplanes couchii TaxID=403638 RepID=A0ABQ3XLA2_9ACTN|nr:serine hydrolase domain-containing protein [Actinoplanes couchii]MDR6318360.1 D-alanyl-D-alanine carboxypeptidase [Actinoplanes couchii]GID59271.1 serine hydrolase [Actinoplanes couchii]
MRKHLMKAAVGTSIALSVTAALVGSGVTGATAGTKQDAMREVVKYTLDFGAPGFMARIDDGRRVTVTAAGLADRDTGRRINGHEQFEAGSNTKTFVAVLALQLVDQRKLVLDAPVERYLPGVVPNGANITVRMLLQHTSGLFNYTGDEEFNSKVFDPDWVPSDTELIGYAFQNAPDFAPGTSWKYSNTNYILAGMIVEKLARADLADLIQQRIAKPLGLTRTYLADPRATSTGRGYAHGYTIDFSGPQRVYYDTTGWSLAWGGAAGAIISDQRDLSRFFSALLSGKLISPRQLAEMKTTVPVPAEFQIVGEYGLGLMRKDTPCGPVWGHGGDTNGHHSTAVTTADGRRTATSDTTMSPTGIDPRRYIQLMLAAEDAISCQMLGKPVPAEVLGKLRGTTPLPPAEQAS